MYYDHSPRMLLQMASDILDGMDRVLTNLKWNLNDLTPEQILNKLAEMSDQPFDEFSKCIAHATEIFSILDTYAKEKEAKEAELEALEKKRIESEKEEVQCEDLGLEPITESDIDQASEDGDETQEEVDEEEVPF